MKLGFLSKVLQTFDRVAIRQEEYGIDKYGEPLDPFNKKHDWLNMSLEELTDGFKYLVAERERRDQFVREIMNHVKLVRKGLQESEIDSTEYQYINLQLKAIESKCEGLSFQLNGDDIRTEKVR